MHGQRQRQMNRLSPSCSVVGLARAGVVPGPRWGPLPPRAIARLAAWGEVVGDERGESAQARVRLGVAEGVIC